MDLKEVSQIVTTLGKEFKQNEKFILHSQSDIETKQKRNNAIRERLLKIRDQIDDIINDAKQADVSSMSIDDLEINTRAKNVLRQKHITTVAKLEKKTFAQLVALKKLGRKSAIQIRDALLALGTSLKE